MRGYPEFGIPPDDFLRDVNTVRLSYLSLIKNRESASLFVLSNIKIDRPFKPIEPLEHKYDLERDPIGRNGETEPIDNYPYLSVSSRKTSSPHPTRIHLVAFIANRRAR